MHLFLLDDDELNNEILASVIADFEGISNLSIQSDGWEALEFLGQCKHQQRFPDLLLIDLKMPSMDGEEFIQRYESEFFPEYPQTKIIVLSNSTLNRERDKVLRYKSVFDFFTKPIDLDKLKDLVVKVC